MNPNTLKSRPQPVRITAASAEDAGALLHIYAPYVTNTAITFEYEVPSLEKFRQRIENILPRYPYLTARDLSGKLLGYAYASPFHERAAYQWAVETSIYIDQSCRGRGVGRRLYDALENVLKEQHFLNLNACIAYPQIEDEFLTKNSVRFHEHMGYRLVGEFHQCGFKFHRWYNMVWMEKAIGRHTKAPETILLFSQLSGDQLKKCGITP